MSKNKLFFDKKGEFVIKFEWEEKDIFDNIDVNWINFKALEACSEYTDIDNPVFNNYDLGRGYESEEHKIEDFDTYLNEDTKLLEGFIKWDGCMEIHNLNHHFCGYDNFLQRIVYSIYSNAKNIMKNNFDLDLANFKEDLTEDISK